MHRHRVSESKVMPYQYWNHVAEATVRSRVGNRAGSIALVAHGERDQMEFLTRSGNG